MYEGGQNGANQVVKAIIKKATDYFSAANGSAVLTAENLGEGAKSSFKNLLAPSSARTQ